MKTLISSPDSWAEPHWGNVVVCQVMMCSNVTVGITIFCGSFVFSQSLVKVSASVTNVGSLGVDQSI